MKGSRKIWAAIVVAVLGVAPGNAEGKSDAEYQLGAALGGPGFSWYSAHIDGRHYEAASSGDAYLLSPSLSLLGDWVLFKYFELGLRVEFSYPLEPSLARYLHFRTLVAPTLRIPLSRLEFELGVEGGTHLIHFVPRTQDIDNPTGLGWTVGARLAVLLRLGASRRWAAGLEVRNLIENGRWASDGCCGWALALGAAGLKLTRSF